ncbi:hypothetical protein D1J63_25320 [Streptomyces sp. KPB2]|uniref:hypothetical protein n=1 Tax=unclassified Streptomyces TaxID=2593676 RepID=UPI000F6EBFB1|nr:hypothetical protein [Streptomyces sp. KPB2]AZM77876.1 hypothetical protein D1J63_25320 [Streptomyces sp. KPB2]
MELECAIYVATRNWERVRIALLENPPEACVEENELRFPFTVAELGRNDYEGTVKSDDDFIGWPSVLEFEPIEGASLGEVAQTISEVLRSLWSAGFRAVAACDYEDLLPHNGGAALY